MDGADNPRIPLLSLVQESFLPKTVSTLYGEVSGGGLSPQEAKDQHLKSNTLLEEGQEAPYTLEVALKCILVGINIASITIGVIYINDCPGQYLIPYYLIISGVACLLYLSMTCLPCIDEDRVTCVNFASLCAQGVMLLFLFAFFIAGNVWIYSLTHESWDDPSSLKRCNRVLYLYAFWTITLVHLCFLVLLCTYLCLLLGLYILKRSIFGSRSN